MAESVEQLERRLASVPRGIERIDILIELSFVSHAIDVDRARQYVDEALRLLESDPDDQRLVKALRAHAFCDMLCSRNREALATLQKARALSHAIGDIEGEANAINLTGSIHKSLGDSVGSLTHYLESLRLYETTTDLLGTGAVLNNIGNAYKSLGDFTLALEYHLRSLDIAVELGSRQGEASVLNNIGNICMSLEEFSKAHDYYLRSLAIKEDLGEPRSLGNSLGNVGLFHDALGEHEKAIEFHLRGLENFRLAGDLEGEANSLCNLSVSWCECDNLDLALRYGNEALELCRKIGDREGESVALLGIGNAFRTKGVPGIAIERLGEALAIAVELEVRPLIVKIHTGLCKALRDVGDSASALEHLRRAYAIGEEIASAQARQSIGNRQLLYDVERARKEAEIERLRNVDLARTLSELEEAQAELVQAEKMAYIGHLTAGVTDQARHPVAAIDRALGPLTDAARELLELGRRFHDAIEAGRDPVEDPADGLRTWSVDDLLSRITRGLASIEEEAIRTSAIVEGLRAFSRLDEGALKMADLDEGIRALLTLVRNRCQGRITIGYDPGVLPPVECFPGQINQSVLAIVSEAIDTIEGEGEITIATEAGEREVEIVISGRSLGGNRTSNAGLADYDAGDSLAVSVAREIVRRHGGDLHVERDPVIGSRTLLRIPIRQRGMRATTTQIEKA